MSESTSTQRSGICPPMSRRSRTGAMSTDTQSRLQWASLTRGGRGSSVSLLLRRLCSVKTIRELRKHIVWQTILNYLEAAQFICEISSNSQNLSFQVQTRVLIWTRTWKSKYQIVVVGKNYDIEN